MAKFPRSSTEFSGKRESAVSTNERLQEEAIAVLNVIENPDVAQALRQDKIQNLAYLKEHYNVSFSLVICCIANGVSSFAMSYGDLPRVSPRSCAEHSLGDFLR